MNDWILYVVIGVAVFCFFLMLYFELKAGMCGSTRFLVYDEPVRLRGVVCRHYRCQDCNADYFVVAEPVLVAH